MSDPQIIPLGSLAEAAALGAQLSAEEHNSLSGIPMSGPTGYHAMEP